MNGVSGKGIHMARFLRGDEKVCDVEIGQLCLELLATVCEISLCTVSFAVTIAYHLHSRFKCISPRSHVMRLPNSRRSAQKILDIGGSSMKRIS